MGLTTQERNPWDHLLASPVGRVPGGEAWKRPEAFSANTQASQSLRSSAPSPALAPLTSA